MKRARRTSTVTSSWSAPSSKPSAGSSAARAHQCKACSLRKKHLGERVNTRWYCQACSLDSKKRAYLCIVCARTVRTGTRATRFDTWSWTTAGTARARASDMPSRCGRRPPSRDTSAVAPQRGKTTKAPSLRLPATKTVLTGAKTGMSPTVW
ncbi:hypothetical protein PC113_g21284 [Phytophthora cactorum]|uniref:PiggyBac transposable element-derived protein 4 C-terminal zinc-ribbon domain-containing protein n=1 Tax=Phytophthora cactorum TaxID=29920 RepID=A0A8T0YJK3_9STRA|nr:hypothetical protein PC113_g21284 [Phytophthora cactorum]